MLCGLPMKEVPFPEVKVKSLILHENYHVKRLLGKGGSAKVYELQEKASSAERFACKVLSKKRYNNEKIYKEIKILNQLRHPNIIKFHEFYENKMDIFIVMQNAKGGELYQALHDHGKFPEEIARVVIKSLLEALQYLHGLNIIHRDIKLENILLSRTIDVSDLQLLSSDVLLVDFGLAKQLDYPTQRTFSLCGSQYYVAPEVWLGTGYGIEVDLWGVGVVLYMLLTNSPPFYKTHEKRLRDAIIAGNYNMETSLFEGVSEGCKFFLSKLLTLNPRNRLSAQQSLSESWVLNTGD